MVSRTFDNRSQNPEKIKIFVGSLPRALQLSAVLIVDRRQSARTVTVLSVYGVSGFAQTPGKGLRFIFPSALLRLVGHMRLCGFKVHDVII